MKRIVLSLLVLLCVGTLSAQTEIDRMKVVVYNDGTLAGRYVRQTATHYIANPLDWEEQVPKKKGRIEIWTPEKGKGFVVRRDGVTGNLNVRKGPSTRTAVVATITEEDSNKDYPDCAFDCLGKQNGWYKIKIKGTVGWVRQDLVLWAAYYAD